MSHTHGTPTYPRYTNIPTVHPHTHGTATYPRYTRIPTVRSHIHGTPTYPRYTHILRHCPIICDYFDGFFGDFITANTWVDYCVPHASQHVRGLGLPSPCPAGRASCRAWPSPQGSQVMGGRCSLAPHTVCARRPPSLPGHARRRTVAFSPVLHSLK